GRTRGTQLRAGEHALLAADAEPDESPDGGAELGGFVTRQVRALDGGDVAVLVLVDRQAVDHLDGVRLSEAVELGQDLTPEIGLLEAEDEQLYWSDCHRSPSI